MPEETTTEGVETTINETETTSTDSTEAPEEVTPTEEPAA